MDTSHPDTCEFDRLFSRNIPHVLEKIFFSLDLASFKNCRKVSSSWNELFMTESYCAKGSQLTLEMKQNQMKLLEAIDKGRFEEHSEESTQEVQRLLSLGVNPDGDDNASPLCEHVTPQESNHQIQIVEMMLMAPKTPMCEHTIPLCLAAKMGTIEMVEMLLNHGADLDKTDKDGCTPLDLAVRKRRKETSLFLIKRGANKGQGGIYDEYSLTWAIETREISIVKLFLDGGASLQHLLNGGVMTPYGRTPVLVHLLKLVDEYPFKKGYESDRNKSLLAEAVLDAGADPNVTDKSGNHVVSLAVHHRNINMIKLLLNKGADPKMVKLGAQDSLLDWARMPDKDIIALLISNGADPTKADLWGITPLIILSGRADMYDTVKMLLNNGSDPNSAALHGITPLYKAAKSGHKDLVQLLLDNAADPNKATTDGNTPLHGAAMHGHRDVVKILLERGAKTATTNKAGEAPWHVAERAGHKDLAKMLSSVRSNQKRKYHE